ncbi:N-acetyltransferase family protein [Flavobacterium sp. RSSA_27]|uniref:GNAT family N-acetyltransferase n=1 Tax=Flavobacterium sp. RSSA_27 TaxID=3447667 RepID=UPI003F3AA05F
MITILPATSMDFDTIRAIAHETWPVAYGEILSKAQLEYMLGEFYNDSALKKCVTQKGHQFVLAIEGNQTLGFASFESNYNNQKQTKIHKIYILPSAQGKGVGKALIDYIASKARKQGSQSICLNVNRFNRAINFYEKMGFSISSEVNIELEHGYLMEDYIMELHL